MKTLHSIEHKRGRPTLTKETLQILKFSQKNALFFEIMYRFLTGPLYLLLLNKGIQFALEMEGYSYLTAGNIGYFLLKPWTLLVILIIGIIGMALLTLEAGCLITLFQGAAYCRKLSVLEIIIGGLRKLTDEIRKRNWKLGFLILINYGLSNLYLIYRISVRAKPLDFVLEEMSKQIGWVLFIVIAILGLTAFAIPGLYTFHACMIEQKNFRDGYHKSRKLLKNHKMHTFFLLSGYHLILIGIMHVIYAFCVLIMAVIMIQFTDNRLALAVLPEACDRVEFVLIFITSSILAIGNFAALTVQYYQYGNRLNREARWDFSYPPKQSLKGRVMGIGIVALAMLSMFFLFDVVRNGSALTNDILVETQITAHRGSSRTAPENTMAAMKAAVEEMADFVEIDVQETSDGVAVLGHDSSLKRVAGVNRSISSYSYKALLDVDVGRFFSTEYIGEQIPTLDEVMQFCKGHINMNIEIKNLGDKSSLPEQVASLIDQYQMKEQCVVTSTKLSYLRKIKELNPDIRTGYIISAAYGDYYSDEDIDFISLRSSFVSEKLVTAAHEKGKAIHAWTVNNKSEMERMKMLGVDNIITDYPILAREIIYREKATETLLEYLRLILK